ncbi:MAG: PDZ domain-containing protein [Planctomycetota bacterium]
MALAAPLLLATAVPTPAQDAGRDTGPDASQPEPTLRDSWVEQLRWRSIGPANMGGRIVDLAVYEDDPSIWYAATASGGILKTVNNGTTFEHQFDDQNTVSIGDMDVAATDPDLVWVGTGEQNPRNSVSFGDGVYKSTDGGATWEHKGLEETFQVGKVIIHPEDHDIVYVGAMGRLWGTNEQRGLFRTTDGGDSWEKILYVDDTTGVIDMAMHPEDPDVILVAMWERQRDEFDTNDPAKRWGPGSGLYRTDDGGDTFEEITDGLPSVDMGRMGLSWSRSNPDDVYALVDSVKIGGGIANPGFMGMSGRDAEAGARLTSITDDGPAAEAGLEVGDIVVGIDDERIVSYDTLLSAIRIREAGTDAVVEVVRDGELMEFDITFGEPPEPNETPFTSDLGGQREDVHHLQGDEGVDTGGLYKSTDAGKTWTRLNSINPRPMYFSKVYVDPSDDDYQWVLGIRLAKSEDGGESWSRNGAPGVVHVDHHALWINPDDGEHIILGNDGGIYVTYDRGLNWDHLDHAAIGQFYHVTVDNQPLYNVYGGLQDNGSWGGPNRTRTSEGTYNTDWFRVGGGDGFICRVDADDPNQIYYSSQNGGLARVHLLTGERRGLRPRAPRGTRYRWNWQTPHMLSHHNPKIYYTAGNVVFRSFHKGDDPKVISPEITRTRRGAATAFDESPRDADLLMVGTDDGALWVTRDGGENWQNILFPYDETAFAEENEGDEEGSEESADESEGEAAEPAEGQRGQRAGRLAQLLERVDANDDGRIQRSEMPERMQRMFDRLDANDDDVIDAKEIEQAAGRLRQEGGADAERRAERRLVPEAGSDDVAQPETPQGPIDGEWIAELQGEAAGGDPFTLDFKDLEEGALRVSIRSTNLDADTEGGSFDADTGRFRFEVSGQIGRVVVTGTLAEGAITGTVEATDVGFAAPFKATRAGGEATEQPEGPTLASLVPGPRRVSSIEWSRFETNRVYVTLDGHYYDDDAPHVFASEDAGKTWRSLRANLPDGTTRVIREDLENPDLLYLGTEFALWVSIDRGRSWTKLNSNLPTVAIHEVAQHVTSGEVIVATHGRSIWALDVTPLRQFSAERSDEPAWLYEPNDVIRWRLTGSRGRGASRWFAGQNPGSSAQIFYSLGRAQRDLELTVYDVGGRLVRELSVPSTEPGLHRVSWDLRREPPAGQQGRFRRGPLVPPGAYRVVMSHGDSRVGRNLVVHGDPTVPGGAFATEEFLAELYADEEDEAGGDEDEGRAR